MVKSGNKQRRTPKIVDDVIDSSDDEEIDEDEAFNSEDERKYGALFAPSKKSSSKKRRKASTKDTNDDGASSSDSSSDDESASDDDEDDDGIASDDDASEGDGGQYMLDLLNNLDRKTEDKEKDRHADSRAAAVHYSTNTLSESEFPAGAVDGNGDGSALTMDQLMGGIANTKGYASLQKSLSSIHPLTTSASTTTAASTIGSSTTPTPRLSTTTAPLPKIITQRTERKIHYAEASEDVTQWTEAVTENRRAETLDFRPQGRIKINRDGLVGKFKVETDFEKEMAQVLEGTGGGEEEMIKAEEQKLLGDDEDGDDLGEKRLCMEEYKRRHGELAKMRALLFYEEQKRRHINKIKSKKYRKIRKKKRIRNEEAEDADAMEEDGALAREMEEKAEMDRIKERISLKHKNTSKWAKRVLRRGGAIDGETRKALSEQIRIGDDLRKKMLGTRDDDDDDDDDDDEKMDLLEEAKLIVADTQKDDDEAKKGIFNLAFMKRGMESQRKRAKEEARELLRELQANEENSYTNDDTQVQKETKKKKKKAASEKEIEKILDDGKLVAKSLQFGNSTGVSVSGSLTVDIDAPTPKVPLTNTSHEDGIYTTNISLSNVNSNTTEDTVSKSSDDVTAAVPIFMEVQKDATTTSFNPWLRSTSDDDDDDNDDDDNDNDGKSTLENKSATKVVRKTKKTLPAVSKRGVINIAGAVNIVSGEDESSNEDTGIESSKEVTMTTTTRENGDSESNIATLSQAELFRRAFAAPEEAEVEREFEAEKDAVRDRDDYLKRKKAEENKVLPGWGSWAGDGAPPPRPSKRRLPKKMQPPEPKPKKRLREDDRKKNVIISAKRMKKMAKFQVGDIPHPFSSREQYEQALSGAVGREWNVSGAVKDMTRASVITRAGKMIRPMSKKVKAKRAPAKF